MRGGDSSGIRAYNERLTVSAILEAGPLSKAALARQTGLSANAAMVISNRLIAQGLLVKGDPVRGQVGQPSTPIAVNPEGAFSIGVKVGRRSVQAMLVNLCGEAIAERETLYAYPEPRSTITTAIGQCASLLSTLDQEQQERVVGLGIAIPGDLDAWTEELGIAPGMLESWSSIDIASHLGQATGLETTVLNDASAACAAEIIAGNSITHQSALYLFFGTFIGGGVVLGGRLHLGERRNAGAIGSMPTTATTNGSRPNQLIHYASLLRLEAQLAGHGIDPAAALSGEGGARADAAFRTWFDTAAPATARAIVSALSVIDFEAVVLDGSLNRGWLQQLHARIIKALAEQNLSGLLMPEIAIGSIGAPAPVLGAALMPLRTRFSPDPGLVVRSGGPR